MSPKQLYLITSSSWPKSNGSLKVESCSCLNAWELDSYITWKHFSKEEEERNAGKKYLLQHCQREFQCSVPSAVCHSSKDQKQPTKGFIRKRGSENMQPIYWRTLMSKCDFNSNFIEITLRHGCSSVNWLHIFRAPLPKNTPGRLLLKKINETLVHSLKKSKDASF